MDELEIKKLEDSLIPIWETKGMTAEEYAQNLTERLKQFNDILNGRRKDTSIVKSTITDTLQFIAWASAKKELTSAVALIRAEMMKAKGRGHVRSDRSPTKGID